MVSSGTGSNLHVIANIDYGFMLESINEDEETPKRKRKKKKQALERNLSVFKKLNHCVSFTSYVSTFHVTIDITIEN